MTDGWDRNDERREEPLTLAALLTVIYPIPRDTVSLEEFQRRRHEDLPELPSAQLERDKDRVRLRMTIDPDPFNAVWLAERRQRLLAEIERRRPPRTVRIATPAHRDAHAAQPHPQPHPSPPSPQFVARANGKEQRV